MNKNEFGNLEAVCECGDKLVLTNVGYVDESGLYWAEWACGKCSQDYISEWFEGEDYQTWHEVSR